MEDKSEAPKTSQQKSSELPVLLRLNRRMVVFLFLTDCFFIMLYAAGNYQDFLDSNLKFILSAICANSIALFFFSASAAAESIYHLIKQKKSVFIFHMLTFTLSTALSIFLTIASLSINILSEGFAF